MLDNVLFIGEPNGVSLSCFRDDTTTPPTYLNELEGATFFIKDTDDDIVGTTHSLTYVSGSDGNYRGTYPASEAAMLVEGVTYFVWVVVPDYTTRKLERIAAYRGKV